MEKRKYTVKYNDSDTMIELDGYGLQENIVSLFYNDVSENLSGFVIYDSDGNVVKDCSGYKYRYDVLEDNPNAIYYSNSESIVQTEKWKHGDYVMEQEPLTNEELTECVADLLYEMSILQLGMEV